MKTAFWIVFYLICAGVGVWGSHWLAPHVGPMFVGLVGGVAALLLGGLLGYFTFEADMRYLRRKYGQGWERSTPQDQGASVGPDTRIRDFLHDTFAYRPRSDCN